MEKYPLSQISSLIKEEHVKKISPDIGIFLLVEKHKIEIERLQKESTPLLMTRKHFSDKGRSKVSVQEFLEVFLSIKLLKERLGVIEFFTWGRFLKELDPKKIIEEINQ